MCNFYGSLDNELCCGATIRCAEGNYLISFNWSENYYVFTANNLSSFAYATKAEQFNTLPPDESRRS